MMQIDAPTSCSGKRNGVAFSRKPVVNPVTVFVCMSTAREALKGWLELGMGQ